MRNTRFLWIGALAALLVPLLVVRFAPSLGGVLQVLVATVMVVSGAAMGRVALVEWSSRPPAVRLLALGLASGATMALGILVATRYGTADGIWIPVRIALLAIAVGGAFVADRHARDHTPDR